MLDPYEFVVWLEFAKGGGYWEAGGADGGQRPPIKPINKAKRMPFIRSSGVILKANARFEKV